MQKTIGLPPPKDAPVAATPHAVRAARLLNLVGLATPLANLGLLRVGPRSQRWFGVGAGVVCAVAGAVGLHRQMSWLVVSALGVHYALVAIGLVRPLVVADIGRAWSAFGAALGKVMALPIFTLLYLLVVTPTGLLVRAFGKDPLARGAAPADTYWTPHEPPPKEKYDRQF
jgi:hypothetical protein